MYGAQTCIIRQQLIDMFENDVEMYGAQTTHSSQRFARSLRMM